MSWKYQRSNVGGNRDLAIHALNTEFQVRHHLYTTDVVEVIEGICRRGDSNPHELPHTPLKRARLPVPPLPLRVTCLPRESNSNHDSVQVGSPLAFSRLLLRLLTGRRGRWRRASGRSRRRSRGSRAALRGGVRAFRRCGRSRRRSDRRRSRRRLWHAALYQRALAAAADAQREQQRGEEESYRRADGYLRENRLRAARAEGRA